MAAPAPSLVRSYFTYQGEAIPDIRQWARLRGERMVIYEATQRTPRAGAIEVMKWHGESPESMWLSMIHADPYVTYREVRRVAP
jgi:hypothetical protein